MPFVLGVIEIRLAAELQVLVPLLAQALDQKSTLERIEQKVEQIIMTDAELKALLTKVDATTNSIAANDTVIAGAVQTVSDVLDAFIASHPAGTVITDEEIATLQSNADVLQQASDAQKTQIAALQGIAAKGQAVVPPAPPSPVLNG